MKFKVFLFGMVAAAIMMSCNNETVYQGTDDPWVEGVSTHATFTLNFSRPPGTYAGDDVITATGYETDVHDAAMFIYKDQGGGVTSPEAMAYLPLSELSALTPIDPSTLYSVTMATTSGAKKIFIALNIDNSTMPILNNTGFTTAQLDTGIVYTNPFSSLNNILYTNGATFTKTTPTPILSSATPNTNLANGLIRTFAGGSIDSGDGFLLSTETPQGGEYCFMTNWDGPDDFNTGGNTYASKCSFTLVANVSLAASKDDDPSIHKGNHIEIGVQRAYAKISLRVTADGDVPRTGDAAYYGPYESSLPDDSKGFFIPWTDGSGTSNVGLWTLGGINTQEYPFQQFGKDFAGAIYPNQVLSPNWAWSVGDTIEIDDIPNSDKWYTNYDNTRVFGTTRNYGSLTVTGVQAAMTTGPAALPLNFSNPLGGTGLVFAFSTENGTEYPQKQDKSTYVVFGGTYKPANIVTSLLKQGVDSYAADIGWNNTPAVATNGPSQGYNPAPVGFGSCPDITWAPGSLDTLYYLANVKVFIWGLDNLAKYIAWQIKVDQTLTAPTVSDPTIEAYINTLIANNEFFAYYRGICWYRVWVRDPSVAKGPLGFDEVLVRRNHVYDVNITKINGPGIADPNNIIIPGEIIPEQETFVTADIIMLDWHKVSSDQEVDNK